MAFKADLFQYTGILDSGTTPIGLTPSGGARDTRDREGHTSRFRMAREFALVSGRPV